MNSDSKINIFSIKPSSSPDDEQNNDQLLPQPLSHTPRPFDYGLLLALLLPLFAIAPLLNHAGLPNTADGPAHLMRQVELNQAWQEGNLYPRWGTDLAFGHGMPIFSYAPPALYQLTQLFHLLGLPLDESMKGVLVLDFLLYSVGMFLFARRLFGSYPALFAAALYIYAPYRLREAYIQGNYGQFTGLAFYPFICWAFYGLVTTGQTHYSLRDRRRYTNRYLVVAALSLAGLLFSHNISFMIFAPLLAGYVLFLLILAARPLSSLPSRLWPIFAAGLLGLGLAAIFWLPAFGERHEIQLEGITRGFFDFRENFISLQEFFALPLPLDLAAINPKFPLSLGLPQILGTAAGLIALLLIGLRRTLRPFQPNHPKPRPNLPTSLGEPSTPTLQPPSGRNLPTSLGELSNLPPVATLQPSSGRNLPTSLGEPSNLPTSLRSQPSNLHPPIPTPHLPLFFAFFLCLYTFLALPQSEAIWAAAPLLKLAEFPWRMLGPAIFCASLLGAFGLATIMDVLTHSVSRGSFLRRTSTLYLLIPIFLVIILNAYYLYPSQFIVWGTPGPADAFAYEVASGAIGTTSTGEFLPRYAPQHPRPDALRLDYEARRPPQKINPTSLPPGATVETIDHRSEADIFLIKTAKEFTATIRTLYWPGWQVYLDDRPSPFIITPETGLIQTIIPPGQHTLTIRLESTPFRTIGLWLTILACGILVVIAGMTFQKNFLPGRDVTCNVSTDAEIPFFFTVIAAILLVFFYLLSWPLAPFFTPQSDPNRPHPAGQILQVDFGQQAAQKPLLRLVGMDELPSAIELTGYQTELAATLYWRALPDLETNYSVFLHLDAPNGQTFAAVDETHPENIPTRNWPPGLYLRNPLHLKISPNLPPIRYDLTVGWYDRRNNTRLVILPGETTTFKLGSIWLTRPHPHLSQTPSAHFGPYITLWQADYSNGSLTLYWQTTQPLDQDDAIFVHLLDAQGHILAQADGVPYTGLYPLPNWQPGQIVVDSRPLASLLPADSTALTTIAIGLYNPVTGARLPAADANGNPLPDDSFTLSVKP